MCLFCTLVKISPVKDTGEQLFLITLLVTRWGAMAVIAELNSEKGTIFVAINR